MSMNNCHTNYYFRSGDWSALNDETPVVMVEYNHSANTWMAFEVSIVLSLCLTINIVLLFRWIRRLIAQKSEY